MKLYLTDQANAFPAHLHALKQHAVIPYDRSKLTERSTAIRLDVDQTFSNVAAAALFDYRIFPDSIMTHLTQWAFEGRKMQIGDTIVQQVFLPPSPSFSQKLIFGVRINEVILEQKRIGFSYETLKGHVEKGCSSFTVEETEDREVLFKIHTFSAPNTFLAQVLGPFFSIPYQAFCTRRGLLHVKNQLEHSSR